MPNTILSVAGNSPSFKAKFKMIDFRDRQAHLLRLMDFICLFAPDLACIRLALCFIVLDRFTCWLIKEIGIDFILQ